MNREDEIEQRWTENHQIHQDIAWLVRTVRTARKLRDAVIHRPDDVVPTPPDSDLAKAMGGPFGDLSLLLHEES